MSSRLLLLLRLSLTAFIILNFNLNNKIFKTHQWEEEAGGSKGIFLLFSSHILHILINHRPTNKCWIFNFNLTGNNNPAHVISLLSCKNISEYLFVICIIIMLKHFHHCLNTYKTFHFNCRVQCHLQSLSYVLNLVKIEFLPLAMFCWVDCGFKYVNKNR